MTQADQKWGGAIMVSMDEVKQCAFDQCHPVVLRPHAWNKLYCQECGCKRKAEAARLRMNREELFEEPYEYKELTSKRVADGTTILVVNDLHRPFHDPATLEAVEKFWNDFMPDIEVYNGDNADFYSISRFDKNPTRRFRFKDECMDFRGWLFSRAEKNPDAKRVAIDGNHEDRMRAFIIQNAKELAGLPALEVPSLLGYKDVGAKHLTYNSVFDFLGFRIEHGWKASSGSTPWPINVSRYMASKTGSSGACGHTHRFSVYSWTDSRGSHSYIENGCLCDLNPEYCPPPNWQQAFTYGIVAKNKVHLVPVMIYPDGFRAEGEFYPRLGG